ncbi:GAF domain-containing hybrid sensor histidine kinase/response regulator [Flavobacterium kingsejongi]|uniref:Sensory/regulatory protein RpfC n=1 Tax=Flavobacterium kingsejongi TaxID=1678728 RepID=A0A2S1LSA8_9FLAO|nr:GAF domain-containing hybrid sensor histidine kinase/response regulator [Flavobacterium kingsejongi]AWG26526.1 hypothetical protein FK004_15485 [Flavobacterium kingsejongi]
MTTETFPIPENENDRLNALQRYTILDTLSETEYDAITQLVSYICEVTIAHISFIDDKRQWFKSTLGIEVNEVPRDSTFCQYTIMGSEMVEVSDTLENERFKHHPNVTGGLKVRFYAGMPLTTPDGFNIGTICAIDTAPKNLTAAQKMALDTLSKHVMTQLELRSKNEELIRQRKIAEMAVYAKDSFLANMSHEIRTPMNAIMGFTDLLVQSNLNPEQREYITNVQTAGENLLFIINDILDLSKIESGKLIIESQPFNLKNTLKEVYDLLKIKAVERDLEFDLFLDAELPDIMVGDKGRMNQIIMNLAGNAIKFTEEGEVTIAVKMLAATDTHYSLRFSVKDTGIGISEDQLATIFERFTQAEESTTRKFGGTGLGLNIVKQLVELQNGEIHVKSKIGRGSEFYFTLDFKKATDSDTDMQEEKVMARQINRSVSILLCEDNLLNQHLAKSVIRNFGFDLDIANNGQEGIELLAAKKYDLILMDLQMPVKDGYETTVYIRKELQSNIPIVAMTAHSLVGEQQKCFDIGMDGYVAKPFKQADLWHTITSVLEKENTVSQSPDSSNSKSIDFSYLKEISDGNEEFITDMIGLFLSKMPSETDLLEKAIATNNYAIIKALAHDMRSALSVFQLNDLLIHLDAIEKEAQAHHCTTVSQQEFQALKEKMLTAANALEQSFTPKETDSALRESL